jgi:hypothetical protein
LSASTALLQSLQPRAILRLDLDQRLAADLSFGNQHQIETSDRVCSVSTKALTKEPLRAIPLYGIADAPARRQSQACDVQFVLGCEQREQRPVQPEALSKGPPEVGGAPHPLLRSEPRVGQPPFLCLLGRDAPTPFLATTLQDQTTALGPHTDQEAVGPLSLSIVRLKRALHDGDSGR